MNTELMASVRDVVFKDTDRHYQGAWLEIPGVLNRAQDVHLALIAVEDIRPFALEPVELMARGACATSGCVAGWAAVLGSPAGTKVRYGRSGVDFLPAGGPAARTAAEYAQELLGLTDDQAAWLFASERSRGEVLAGLDYLIEHPEASFYDLVGLNEDEYQDEG